MKKFYIVLSLLALPFQVFAAEPSRMVFGEHKETYFKVVRELLFAMHQSAYSIKEHGSYHCSIDKKTKALKHPIHACFILEKLPQIDKFFAHEDVRREYEKGGSQADRYHEDMRNLAGLVHKMQEIEKRDDIKAPFAKAYAPRMFVEQSAQLLQQRLQQDTMEITEDAATRARAAFFAMD